MTQMAIGSSKQARPVAALSVNLIGSFHASNARPIQAGWIKLYLVALRQLFYPIVGAPDHDGADRSHLLNGLPLCLAAVQSALDGFGYRDCLRNGEAHRGIDRYATVGYLFDRFNSRGGHRNLYDHIWRQAVEVEGLFC